MRDRSLRRPGSAAEPITLFCVSDLMLVRLNFALLMCLAACDAVPQDANGTVERIRSEEILRAARVAGTRDPAAGQQIVDTLARQWQVRVEWHTGPASLLLDQLENGEVDIVLGEFASASPLQKEVSFSEAVGQPEPRDGKRPVLRLARAHGENRLITITDKLVMQ